MAYQDNYTAQISASGAYNADNAWLLKNPLHMAIKHQTYTNANVVQNSLKIVGGANVQPKLHTFTGLKPNTAYCIQYLIVTEEGQKYPYTTDLSQVKYFKNGDHMERKWLVDNALVEQVIVEGVYDRVESSGTVYSKELNKTLDIAKIHDNISFSGQGGRGLVTSIAALNNLGDVVQGYGADALRTAYGETAAMRLMNYSNRYSWYANQYIQNQPTYVIKKAGTNTNLYSSSNGIIQVFYRPSIGLGPNLVLEWNMVKESLQKLTGEDVISAISTIPGLDFFVPSNGGPQNNYLNYIRLQEVVSETGPIIDNPDPPVIVDPPPIVKDDTFPKMETIVKPGKWSNWNVYKTQTKKINSKTETTITNIGEPWTEYANTFNGATALSEVSLYFDYIQTFTVDKAAVQGSDTVTIDSIELFFKKKPHYKNNVSGIENPSVSIYLCETQGVEKYPNLSKALKASVTRLNYNEINSSLYADSPTVFQFKYPLTIPTDKTYGIVINYEDPTYSLWFGEEGKPIVKYEYTDGAYSVFTSGSSSNLTARNYIGGKLYVASNYQEIDDDPSTKDALFKALNSKDIKFNVNIRKYDNSQSYTVELVNDDYDYIRVNEIPVSTYGVSMSKGQKVYQSFGNTAANCEFRSSGIVNIGYVPGSSALTTIFGNQVSECFYIQTSDSKNAYDAAFLRSFYVGQNIILSHVDPTKTVEYHAIVNGIARYNPAPIRLILAGNPGFASSMFGDNGRLGTEDMYIKGVAPAQLEDWRSLSNGDILLKVKNQNSFFYNTGINYVKINDGGSGFANGDWFDVPGSYDSQARIQVFTDNLGVINETIIINPGLGYTDTSGALTVYKNTFNPLIDNNNLGNPTTTKLSSNTAAANLEFFIGGQIKSFNFDAQTDIVSVDDIDVNTYVPNLSLSFENASSTNYNIVFAEYDDDDKPQIKTSNYSDFTEGVTTDITSYNAKILSKSNEIKHSDTLGKSSAEGKSSLIKFDIVTQNQYQSPELIEALASVHSFSNEINNDDTDEVLPGSGEAISRHISNKVIFGKDRFAEDIRILVNAWKPLGTDFKIYAKIHHSGDEDSFDEKYWSELEIKNYINERQYSNLTDTADTIQFEYGFYTTPTLGSRNFAVNTIVKSSGTVTVDTQDDHNLSTGHFVTISNSTNYNGISGTAITVNSNTQFEYTDSGTTAQETSTEDDVIFYKRYLDNSYTGSITGTTVTIGSTTGLAEGDALFIYDPDFKEDKNTIIVIDSITDSTHFEITEDLSGSQMDGIDFKISLIDEYSLYQAHNNTNNNNIVRYLNGANTIFDYYDSMSVKIVPLSPSKWIVPQIDDISVIGVSA